MGRETGWLAMWCSTSWSRKTEVYSKTKYSYGIPRSSSKTGRLWLIIYESQIIKECKPCLSKSFESSHNFFSFFRVKSILKFVFKFLRFIIFNFPCFKNLHLSSFRRPKSWLVRSPRMEVTLLKKDDNSS